MKIEKDTVTFEAPDADFVTKFGIQAAADMVLDFHCFHPQLPFQIGRASCRERV